METNYNITTPPPELSEFGAPNQCALISQWLSLSCKVGLTVIIAK